jgi:hypothetical protein
MTVVIKMAFRTLVPNASTALVLGATKGPAPSSREVHGLRSKERSPSLPAPRPGIGEAMVQRLAAAGYKVYGTSRRGAQAGQQSFEMLPLSEWQQKPVRIGTNLPIRAHPHRCGPHQRLCCRIRSAAVSSRPKSRRRHDISRSRRKRLAHRRDHDETIGRGGSQTCWRHCRGRF